MADAATRIYGPTGLTGSAATVYTVPGATSIVLKHIVAANPTAADRKVYLSIGADAVGTRLLPGVTVPANDVLPLDVWIPLAAAETIQAYSDSSGGITLTLAAVVTT